MRALGNSDNNSGNSNIGSNTTIHSDEEADEFGTDPGGWCCFTNSLPIVYLRMWLNERPNMTSFISRKIQDECQLDTSDNATGKKRKLQQPYQCSQKEVINKRNLHQKP
jgi:hypothetical protein